MRRDRPLVMAIVNRTPDSFYDRGATYGTEEALEAAERAVAEGADIIDVGGVKAGPGTDVDVAEETRRVVPFVAELRSRFPDIAISVDTWRHEVGRRQDLGVPAEGLLVDPTHDFGKNTWHSLALTRDLGRLVDTGWPVLVALSNKDFVGEALDLPVDRRLHGTLAATAVCAWQGAAVFRAHNVAETCQALDMVAVIKGDKPPAHVIRGLV
ncbi:hypothetical protein ACZ91_32700 [Streptomyces regensis]|nr:hypothetical protein ACZ91_32700 [Streptomyces regensis]